MAKKNSVKLDISDSLEDYLEAIHYLIANRQAARAKDIGKRLGVSRPSVTGALHALADKELINYSPYGIITLTEQGLAIAMGITRRHEVLRDFFVKILNVDYDEADAAACKMEHAVSDSILKKFLEFVKHCPKGDTEPLKKPAVGCKRTCKSSK